MWSVCVRERKGVWECVCVLVYVRPVGKCLSVCMCLCGQKHACVSVLVPACVRWGGRFQVNERVCVSDNLLSVCVRKGISLYVRVASVCVSVSVYGVCRSACTQICASLCLAMCGPVTS